MLKMLFKPSRMVIVKGKRKHLTKIKKDHG
uniref:Uncharacterized protein n=1 Tax=Tetranychus urticae TaxID=32264 RepID=T1KLB6_TETUR